MKEIKTVIELEFKAEIEDIENLTETEERGVKGIMITYLKELIESDEIAYDIYYNGELVP